MEKKFANFCFRSLDLFYFVVKNYLCIFLLFIKSFIYFADAEKNTTFPGTENKRCLRFLFK